MRGRATQFARPCDASLSSGSPASGLSAHGQSSSLISAIQAGKGNISFIPEVVLRIGGKGVALVEKSPKEEFDKGSVTGL